MADEQTVDLSNIYNYITIGSIIFVNNVFFKVSMADEQTVDLSNIYNYMTIGSIIFVRDYDSIFLRMCWNI